MLSKPRESGKHKKPKVGDGKRMSAPPSQLGNQTMLLKQPQTGNNNNTTSNNNNGDLLDLFTDFSGGNNTNSAANPFDFQGSRPPMTTSKSNPFGTSSSGNGINSMNNMGGMSGGSGITDDLFGSSFGTLGTQDSDDLFGNKAVSNPFDMSTFDNNNSNNSNPGNTVSPRLLKQGSHPVTGSSFNNYKNNRVNLDKQSMPPIPVHVYQDSHAAVDPMFDVSMWNTAQSGGDTNGGGGLLMVVPESKATTKNNDNNNNDYQGPPSKVSNKNNNNNDDEKNNATSDNENLNDDDHEERAKKHKNKKKRKSASNKNKDKDKEKDNATETTPTKADEKKIEETNALEELHRGSALLKYPRRSGFPHFKHIQLSKDNTRIQWYSKRKALDETCILIKDIREVVKGQKTETFKKFQQRTLEKSSFSIVYGMDYKSLDVAAKSIDECQMWVKAVTELYKVSRTGGDVTKLKELFVGIKFKDRNRPRSRQGSGNFIRANNSKTLKIDPESLKEIEKDMETLQKNFQKVTALTAKSVIQKCDEYGNIQTVLSEIEERMEELQQEVANIRDTELAKREVWRANVDLNAMLEKVEVLSKLLDRRKSNLF